MTMLDDRPDTHDSDLDDFDHMICYVCYPGYEPGRRVIAICGSEDDDCPQTDSATLEVDCPFCRLVERCPKCGTYIWI